MTREMWYMIKALKNSKATGLDQITVELLKCGKDTVVVELTNLMIKCWQIEANPDKWQKGIIIKIPNKGNLAKCRTWRGITLLSVSSKVFCVVLIRRLSTAADSKMGEESAGFWQGCSCVEQIFTQQNVKEQCLKFQRSLMINFTNFKKAFDTVHRGHYVPSWGPMEYHNDSSACAKICAWTQTAV